MSKLDDLIAAIKKDVSISKSRKGNVQVSSEAIRAKEAKAKGDDLPKDPALRSLIRAANATANKFLERPADPYAGWTELAIVHKVQPQRCECCGSIHNVIAGEFLKLDGFAPCGEYNTMIRTTALVRRTPKNASLPHEIDPLPEELVTQCFECLAYDKIVEKAWEPTAIAMEQHEVLQ